MPKQVRLEAILVAMICLGFLAAQAPSLEDPFFGDALFYVAPSARDVYLDPSDPIPKGLWDTGHPPLFFWVLAALWLIFGPHLWVAHALVLLCAVVAIVVTYVLGRLLWGPVAGVLAAVLLALHPVFYYTTRTVAIDLLLLALTLLCFLAALRDRWSVAIALGCAMVLTKETGTAFLPAVALGAIFLRPREDRPGWARPAALVLVPALALGAWLVVHRIDAGWWIYLDDSRVVKFTPADLLGLSLPRSVYERSIEPYLRHHGQWLGTLMIVLALVFGWLARRRRPAERAGWILTGVWLGLVLPLGIFIGLIKAYLPRHNLPAIALFCVLVAWAASRAGRAAPLLAAAAAVSLLFGHAGSWKPGWETHRGYVDVVTLDRRAAKYVEREHPDARVAAAPMFWAALCDPFYGYVSKPVHVVAIEHAQRWGTFCPPGTFTPIPRDRLTADDFDLLYVGPITAARGSGMGLEKTLDLHEVARFEEGRHQVVLYSPRPPDEPPRSHPAASP